MERMVIWTPAWDKRHPEPSKDCGIHGVELRFVLRGDKGATQFVLYTNWMLPNLRYGHKQIPGFLAEPLPADVGFHALAPQYEGQEASGPCEFLGGKTCYCDGSGLAADILFDKFVVEGEEAIWRELERRHDELLAPSDTQMRRYIKSRRVDMDYDQEWYDAHIAAQKAADAAYDAAREGDRWGAYHETYNRLMAAFEAGFTCPHCNRVNKTGHCLSCMD